jgi:hypothetical protein
MSRGSLERGGFMATRHNEEVKKAVARLKRMGYGNIKADLPVFEKPDSIGQKGFIPDFQGSKPGKVIIGEVEEEKQVPNQSEQISAFRKSAGQSKRKEFMLVTFQKRKKGSKTSN